MAGSERTTSAPAALDEKLERKVDAMLRKGGDVDDVVKMLTGRGVEPGRARHHAEAADRAYQDALRETNMGKTHGPRQEMVKKGGSAAAMLALIYVLLKLSRLLLGD